jgi:hypothetical protein
MADEAMFNNPTSVQIWAMDGSLLVADCDNNKIKKISTKGKITAHYNPLFPLLSSPLGLI